MSFGVNVQTLKIGEGAYRSGAKTGLLTGISAGTATAGHVWAARWAPATPSGAGTGMAQKRMFAVLQRFRARWYTITGFTGAQEVGLDLFRLTGYSAAHTGGNALTPTPKRSNFRGAPSAALLTGRIATTADLTSGTHVIDTDPMASGAFAELAAGAAVPKGLFELFLSTDDLDRYPVVLAANEGLLLRNTIAMGAAGTARVVVEMDWLEVERY